MKKGDILNLIIAVVVVGGFFIGAYVFFSKDTEKAPVADSLIGLYGTPTPVAETPASSPQPSPTATPAPTPGQKQNMANKIAVMKTNFGNIKLELFSADAPKTVENFEVLTNLGFYNGTKFHRVIKNFMIQGGDPNSKDDDWSNDGMGGPSWSFEDEINSHKLVKGALAMANSGPNTNGSQFFIVTAAATPWLDGHHTVFGQVLEGMDVVLKIEGLKTNENDHPLEDATIEGITISK